MEFFILALIVFFVSFVLPLMNNRSIKRLEAEVEALKTRMARQDRRVPDSQTTTPAAPPSPAPVPTQTLTPLPVAEKPLIVHAAWSAQPGAPKPAAAKAKTTPAFILPSFDRLLARLPVWIGAIALVFACLYFVKYSIEQGLLSPAVRLMIGSATSALAVIAGYILANQPRVANHTRIAQALAGAGVAGLYICSYMSAHLYDLLSAQGAIVVMGAITALAVFLSLRIGAPVALLGLLGGFALPLLTQFQQVNTGALLAYFFVLTIGLVFVAALRNWGWLAILALVAFYGWGFGTLFDRAALEHTATYVGGFSLLTIVGILVIGALLPHISGTANTKGHTIIERALIMSFVLSAVSLIIAMFRIDMSFVTTGMYALLAIGAAVLAVFRQHDYLRGAFIAMAVFAGLLAVAPMLEQPALLLGLATFGVLIAFGFTAMWRMRAHATEWSIYTVASIAALYGV
ncbi:MAG: hypothetical protein C0509_05165, partial [Acinetobacter sp.]|nr:hypothetical protein [Acinetobacter sp.]